MTAYDIIGDIHGQSHKLEALLLHLGYTPNHASYRPPQGRQAVFLGDLIDRGPGQMRVLEIVRSMVDAGHALCIMGNHELNAIGYAVRSAHAPHDFFRPHTPKNHVQHHVFLEAFSHGSAAHQSSIAWFRTLPVYLDLGGLRVVHGCWDDAAIATLADGGWKPGVHLSDALLHSIYEHTSEQEKSPMMQARLLLTCGLELPLPHGYAIEDKAGHKHTAVRIANWRHWATSLHEIALVPKGQEAVLQGLHWPSSLTLAPITGSPILIGHHWFSGAPCIESPKIACLDWSAARDGPLVAYRWDGEAQLSNDNLRWVGGVNGVRSH